VFGFLIFEAAGLVITFFYILKPKFNIAAVYLAIALIYYLTLNVVPMDGIIAKDQIDRYFKTGQEGIYYVLTLSADAAPQVARLLESDDERVKIEAGLYFRRNNGYYSDFVPRWQRWNLSSGRFKNAVSELSLP